ncbi:MAG: hypothetical protein MUC88_29260, partial [Planctomycetes bacterium]|nr:hypothetical protein [Planctomycetota bacterium]
MMSFGTYLSDPVERDIDQEEHWTVGDIVSNTDEKPVGLSQSENTRLMDQIYAALNEDLAATAATIARREGLVPWKEYPELLAQEPWRPGDPKPQPGGNDEIFVDIGGAIVPLDPDLESSDPTHTYTACILAWLEVDFRAHLSVVVTPTSPAYGTWSASVFPEEVGPGEVRVEICVRGENVHLPDVSGGDRLVVAEVTVLAAPVDEPW